MWPQYNATGYPSYCTEEPFDSTIPSTIGWTEMTKYWPNVEYDVTSANYTEFWEHEWTKHGTCTGLLQIDYFKTTLSLIQEFGTPKSVTAAVGSELSADDLRNDFGGASMVALQCESGKYLSGVFTCWSQIDGVPQQQTACSAEVVSEDTCTSPTVVVQAL